MTPRHSYRWTSHVAPSESWHGPLTFLVRAYWEAGSGFSNSIHRRWDMIPFCSDLFMNLDSSAVFPALLVGAPEYRKTEAPNFGGRRDGSDAAWRRRVPAFLLDTLGNDYYLNDTIGLNRIRFS